MVTAAILLASDVTFGIVFGVFVAALGVLAVVAIRWGVRRDRPGREAWRQRRFEAASSSRGAPSAGSVSPSDAPPDGQ